MKYSSPYRRNGTHRRATITAEQACGVVVDSAAGMSRTCDAEKYGVTSSMIGRIVSGHAWFAETLEVRRSVRQKQESK